MNIGKTLTLGGREYTVVTEATAATHPNLFRETGCMLELGIEGRKGALGSLTVWENASTVLWMRGNRVEKFQGAVVLR